MKSLLKRLYRSIYGPMPLSEFKDYNEYWEKRQTSNDSPAVEAPQDTPLHRFVSIAHQIPEGSSVLDVGCGDGGFLRYLKKQDKGLSLFGMDISSEAVANLSQHGIDGAVIHLGTPLRDLTEQNFDYVVMMEVIEHVHEAESLVLDTLAFSPKGIFITIPNAGYFMHRLRLMFGGRFPVTFVLLHMKEHIRFWTVKDFFQWSEHLNLKVTHYEGQQKGTKNPLRLFMIRHFPSLCAAQLIYFLEPKG